MVFIYSDHLIKITPKFCVAFICSASEFLCVKGDYWYMNDARYDTSFHGVQILAMVSEK